MSLVKQKDNSTLKLKRRDRLECLQRLREQPVILEAYGGAGRLFEECYKKIERGAVFEKDAVKADMLARQRPTWSIYNSDCVKSLAGGVASHLTFNFIDLDPYGSPFETMDAIFGYGRPLADSLWMVVNDGLRNKVRVGGAWKCKALLDIVRDWGNNLFDRYLEVAQEKTRRIVDRAGYKVKSFEGYYCGHNSDMSHYWVELSR